MKYGVENPSYLQAVMMRSMPCPMLQSLLHERNGAENSYIRPKYFCMSREERNRISFFVACIGAFAERFSVSNAFAYNYLFQYKGLDFIYDFYDVEHTFSIDDVVDDMLKVCQRNGGQLS